MKDCSHPDLCHYSSVVERGTCNAQVQGSNPCDGFIFIITGEGYEINKHKERFDFKKSNRIKV